MPEQQAEGVLERQRGLKRQQGSDLLEQYEGRPAADRAAYVEGVQAQVGRERTPAGESSAREEVRGRLRGVEVSVLVLLPLAGAVATAILGRRHERRAPWVAVWVSGLTFAYSVLVWYARDPAYRGYQLTSERAWFPVGDRLTLGVDGLSILFVVLTGLLTFLCRVGSWEAIGRKRREYYSLFLLRESRVRRVFLQRNLFGFYVAFEAVLIPRFLLIGVWGSRERKIRAAYFFFLYTLVGSLFRLLALILRYSGAGTRDREYLLNCVVFPQQWEKVFWVAFFLSFAVKVPRVPVHIWLPEAHVEAPTAGSVILAGVLLKLGTYGLLRFLLPLFPVATEFFTPLVFTRAVVAVVYTSLTARRQSDRKRVIAYASVAHRNRTLLGVFSLTSAGVEGAIFQRISHGIVSGALFRCVGVLYDRHHTRLIHYYGGVAHTRPKFVALFLLFTRANIALPGTSSFVGEFLILVGIYQVNFFAAVLSATGRVLGGAYSLWLFNRVAYGNLKRAYTGVSRDLTRREFHAFVPLAVLTVWLGIQPQPLLDTRHASCEDLLRLRQERIEYAAADPVDRGGVRVRGGLLAPQE